MPAFDFATERSEKSERGAAEPSIGWLEPNRFIPAACLSESLHVRGYRQVFPFIIPPVRVQSDPYTD